MMKSEITVRTQGVKGGRAKFETKGCVTIFCTDNGGNQKLTLDADSFTEAGQTYQRRANTLINIEYDRQPLFNGNIQELANTLRGKRLRHPDFLLKMDWSLLRSQKMQLLELAEANNEDLHGIVSLIDAIQDYAVDVMEVRSDDVYDFEFEDNRKDE